MSSGRSQTVAAVQGVAERLYLKPADRSELPDDVPRTWIMTLRDRALSTRQQLDAVTSLGGVDTMVCLDARHDVMFSQPCAACRNPGRAVPDLRPRPPVGLDVLIYGSVYLTDDICSRAPRGGWSGPDRLLRHRTRRAAAPCSGRRPTSGCGANSTQSAAAQPRRV